MLKKLDNTKQKKHVNQIKMQKKSYYTRSNRCLRECVRCLLGVQVAVEGKGWMVRKDNYDYGIL